MMEQVSKNMGQRQRPYIIELVGLAGAGKTTLAHALSQSGENIHVDDDLALKKRAHMPIFAGSVPHLLPLVLRRDQRSSGFTWNEIKAMAYLKGWPPFLRQQNSANRTILLDHGPLFKMATLNAFGPEKLQSTRFDKWWQSTFKQWADALDMIVWLHAPQKMLLERINARNQRHAVKGKSELEAAQFLARYQTSYDQVLAKIELYGGPKIIRFDTSQVPIEHIVEEILATTSQYSYETTQTIERWR